METVRRPKGVLALSSIKAVNRREQKYSYGWLLVAPPRLPLGSNNHA